MDLQALVGIYEWQDNLPMYLVGGERVGEEPTRLRRIRRRVALHGDVPYLGVIDAGRLIVHAVAVDEKGPNGSRIQLEIDERVTFPHLAAQRPNIADKRGAWIANLVRRLLREILRSLRSAGVRETDAISLAGRALFTRFLADRDLIPQSPVSEAEVHALFDEPQWIADTCDWLDDTFNGDLLPLSSRALKTLRPDVYQSLGNWTWRSWSASRSRDYRHWTGTGAIFLGASRTCPANWEWLPATEKSSRTRKSAGDGLPGVSAAYFEGYA